MEMMKPFIATYKKAEVSIEVLVLRFPCEGTDALVCFPEGKLHLVSIYDLEDCQIDWGMGFIGEDVVSGDELY